MHITLDLRVDLIASVAALSGALAASLFTNRVARIENAIINHLSRWMNSRRWFTFWLVGFPIWAIVRSLLMGFVDWDTISITGLWSWWPFAVENIVKVTQGKTLDGISKVLEANTDLVVEIKRQNDRSEERDEAALQRDLTSARRDAALLGAMRSINNLLAQLTAGGPTHARASRKVSSAAKGNRASTGRRKRKAS